MELWIANAVGDRSADGVSEPQPGYCVAFVLPNQTDIRVPGGRGLNVGGGCSGDVGTPAWEAFGEAGVTSGNDELTYFAYRVGDAVRVVFETNRSRQELGVADGWTVGAIHPGSSATIIGFDSNGREIGRKAL